jgi:GntR family histidine utilization transcriptional repressor
MPSDEKSESHRSRLLTALRQAVIDGTWPAGALLPKETELAAQHGVSRMTMNKVLTQLAAEGFLIRRKRLGTLVAGARAQSAVLAITDIAAEVAALGQPYAWALESRALRSPTGGEAALLDLPADAPVVMLRGVHRAGDRPFCAELRAINPAAVPNAETQDFRATAPGAWLLASMPWTSARHRIRAVPAGAAEARALDVPVGSACLEILRQTQAGGTWVTQVRLLYPGPAHQLVAEFAPAGATG